MDKEGGDKGGEERKRKEGKEMKVRKKRASKRTCATGGKRGVERRQIQATVGERERRYGTKGEERREAVVNKIRPVIETKSRKRSGRVQQVPKRVSPSRGEARACTWLREAGQKRGKKRGRPGKEGRRRERARAYEGTQSEPRVRRDRRHKAAKANRVNVR
jgi:ribosomal protein S7